MKNKEKEFPKKKDKQEYRDTLPSDVYRVTEEHGTETPFSSELLHEKENGMYACVRCGTPLFGSEAKFDSGTGWPSFDTPIDKKNVGEEEDDSLFMKRVEVHCNGCGAHLGHVFEDGPQETTGQRYCINGASLDFIKRQNEK